METDKIKVNAFSVDKILLGLKTAILIQHELKPNTIIQLQQDSEPAPFANARVLASVPMKILPNQKAIHRLGSHDWIPCKRHAIEQIVKAKGFASGKEFWTQKKKSFEGHLMYFELYNN